MRGDALLPLAADLDSLVVLDPVATAVQILDHGQNPIVVGVRVAYENIWFTALIGLKIIYHIHGGLYLLAGLFHI